MGPFGKRSGIPHLTLTVSAPGDGEGVLRRKLGRKAMLLGVAIFVLLPASAYLALPSPVLNRSRDVSMLVLARDGSILRGFLSADRIRGELAAEGMILEDRPDGTTDWRRG